ncbi:MULTISPECIES: hypothetical protein [Micromonospora]|uniref:Uncharacterized protein n=1 Tax=Micromonospora yangpuensis TaxID=683228 RepID=A0A1C6U5L5_9ACTN|nr:hypothetical protein [Micromonospora yangpuensis]SCL49218.1 hypothetical protein GA0070617_1114 [Micromonospora yangpuensis]
MESSAQSADTARHSFEYTAYRYLMAGRRCSFAPSDEHGPDSGMFTLRINLYPHEQIHVDTRSWSGINALEVYRIDSRTNFPAASEIHHIEFASARRNLLTAKLVQDLIGRLRTAGLDVGQEANLAASERLLDATREYNRVYTGLRGAGGAGRATGVASAAALPVPGGSSPPPRSEYSWPSPYNPRGGAGAGQLPGVGRP